MDAGVQENEPKTAEAITGTDDPGLREIGSSEDRGIEELRYRHHATAQHCSGVYLYQSPSQAPTEQYNSPLQDNVQQRENTTSDTMEKRHLMQIPVMTAGKSLGFRMP